MFVNDFSTLRNKAQTVVQLLFKVKVFSSKILLISCITRVHILKIMNILNPCCYINIDMRREANQTELMRGSVAIDMNVHTQDFMTLRVSSHWPTST